MKTGVLFESMRWYRNRAVYFPWHIARMRRSAESIGIGFPYSTRQLKNKIEKLVARTALTDAYVKLTLWKTGEGVDISIIVRKHRPYPKQKYKRGFTGQVSGLRQNDCSPLAQVKSTERLLYQLSLKEVAASGFDEAILLNQKGYLTEGSRTNIFFVRDKTIFTPDLACGCLAGITRRAIFDLAKNNGLKIEAGNFTAQDLEEAEEAFLTNSLIGLMPLVRIGNHKIGNGRPGKVTRRLLKAYQQLLKK